MAQANNFQFPRFAKAGTSADQWGEVDNFDVEMLAEYLLDDGTLNAHGITFDFK